MPNKRKRAPSPILDTSDEELSEGPELVEEAGPSEGAKASSSRKGKGKEGQQ